MSSPPFSQKKIEEKMTVKVFPLKGFGEFFSRSGLAMSKKSGAIPKIFKITYVTYSSCEKNCFIFCVYFPKRCLLFGVSTLLVSVKKQHNQRTPGRDHMESKV